MLLVKIFLIEKFSFLRKDNCERKIEFLSISFSLYITSIKIESMDLNSLANESSIDEIRITITRNPKLLRDKTQTGDTLLHLACNKANLNLRERGEEDEDEEEEGKGSW